MWLRDSFGELVAPLSNCALCQNYVSCYTCQLRPFSSHPTLSLLCHLSYTPDMSSHFDAVVVNKTVENFLVLTDISGKKIHTVSYNITMIWFLCLLRCVCLHIYNDVHQSSVVVTADIFWRLVACLLHWWPRLWLCPSLPGDWVVTRASHTVDNAWHFVVTHPPPCVNAQ